MLMKQIGVDYVRQILAEVVSNYEGKMAMRAPDNKLLKMNLRTDFGLDSLDIEDMCDTISNDYGVIVDLYGHHPLGHYSFESKATVENFIETVNYFLEQED